MQIAAKSGPCCCPVSRRSKLRQGFADPPWSRYPRHPRDQITRREIEALENPHVGAIAHPTGRMLMQRRPCEIDMEAVMKAAPQHGKFLELNAHPTRLDLDDVACAAAKRHSIPIVISTDSHNVLGLSAMRYGVQQARRGRVDQGRRGQHADAGADKEDAEVGSARPGLA